MDWSDIDDVLYDGDKEAILALRCPDCGSSFQFLYFPQTHNLEVTCKKCGYFSRAYGNEIPNCYKFLGKQAVV